jgi:methionyl-tRNA formyltransferase
LYSAYPDHIAGIFFQDALIAGKTKFQGLMTYIRRSGYRYVFMQIAKQLCVQLLHRFANPPTRAKAYTWERFRNQEAVIEEIRSLQPDIILSVFSKYILSKQFFSLARLGVYNVHPSLLPAYKGISPTFWVLARNEHSTGISIHRMTERIDEGVIVGQRMVQILPNDSEHRVYLRCAYQGADLAKQIVGALIDNKPIEPIEVNGRIPSYFSFPSRSAYRELRRNHASLFSFRDLLQLFSRSPR